MPYFAANFYLRQRFGVRVQKVSIDAGFTCPNVDGTVATGGCTFCDNRSFSPSRRLPRARHPRANRRRHSADAAALQELPRLPGLLSAGHEHLCAGRSTAAAVRRSARHPQVVGLAIGTRPDCVPDDVLDLLARACRSELSVGRVRHADDARSLARLDEPRPSSRRDARRGRAQPRSRLRDRRARHARPARRIARRHAGHGPRGGAAAASTP